MNRIIEYYHETRLNILSSCAQQKGFSITFDDMVNKTKNICRKTANNRCSMLQDITSGRKTEIDHINGFIIKEAKKNLINTPYNNTIYFLIKSRE